MYKTILSLLAITVLSLVLIQSIQALSERQKMDIQNSYTMAYANGTINDASEAFLKGQDAIKAAEVKDKIAKDVIMPGQNLSSPLLFRNIKIDRDTEGVFYLNGEVQNNNNQTYHFVKVKAKFFDTDHKLIGAAYNFVVGTDVGVNETVPFKIMITDGEVVSPNGVNDIAKYSLSLSYLN